LINTTSSVCKVYIYTVLESRSFATVGLSSWNKLPQSLRDPFPISNDQFHKHLKTSLFCQWRNWPRSGAPLI